MNYFLVTFTQIDGMPKDELVHFIIKAKTLEDAKTFTETDSYFIDTIMSGYPAVNIKNVNIVIYPLAKLSTLCNELNTNTEMCACVLNDEHTHLTTVEQMEKT